MLAIHSRLMFLACMARLRSASWLPWTLFGAWVALAAAQEPRLLRGFGVHLPVDAAWVAALLLWGGLAGAGDLGCRLSWAANLLLLGGVALLQFGVAALVGDLAAGAASGAMFLIAWSPLALALQRPRVARSQPLLRLLVVVVAILVGSTQSVALRIDGLGPANLLAWAGGIGAGAVWVNITLTTCHK